jgi:TonB family protein
MALRRLLTFQGKDASGASRRGHVACGIGAMLLHGALAWALPAAPERAVPASECLVWLEAQGEQATLAASAGADAQSQGSVPASRPRGTKRARQPSQQPQVRTAPARADVAPEAASVPSEAHDALQVRALEASLAARAGDHERTETASDASASGAAGELRVDPSEATGAAHAAWSAARGPGLVAIGSPCSSFFPADADDDQGEVQIDVSVDAEGHTRASNVLIEAPRGQGFGNAARACVRRLHFAPARAAGGAPVAGHATLKLRFKRHSMS